MVESKGMNITDFYKLVELKQEPEESMLLRLQALTKRYPFFQAGIFTYIKCLYVSSSSNFNSELQRLVPFVQDRRALFYYVLSSEFAQFDKQGSTKLSQSRTDALIDAFFDTLGDGEAERELEHAIANASMASLDYFSYLESATKAELDKTPAVEQAIIEGLSRDNRLEEAPPLSVVQDDSSSLNSTEALEEEEVITPMKHQSIIDNFIFKAEDLSNIRVKIDRSLADDYDEDAPYNEELGNEKELDDDFFFTQTLANIYIKQKKYKRAYEIIKRLSLNYPEKNIYFADQLSFLEKILKNVNHNK